MATARGLLGYTTERSLSSASKICQQHQRSLPGIDGSRAGHFGVVFRIQAFCPIETRTARVSSDQPSTVAVDETQRLGYFILEVWINHGNGLC